MIKAFLIKWLGKDFQTNIGAAVWVGLGVYDFILSKGFTPDNMVAFMTAWAFFNAKDKAD